MGCLPECGQIPSFLVDPTPVELFLWRIISTIPTLGFTFPPPLPPGATECETTLHRIITMAASGVNITTMQCGCTNPRTSTPFGFTEAAGELLAKNLGLEGFTKGSIVTFSAFGPVETGGFSLSSKNVESMCETIKEVAVGFGSGGGATPSPLKLECEQTVDGGDWSEGSCAKIDCEAGSPKLNFRVSGGVAPYSWSIIPATICDSCNAPTLSDSSGSTTTVTPPPSTGSGVIAYTLNVCAYGGCSSGKCVCNFSKVNIDCQDNRIGTFGGAGCTTFPTTLKDGSCGQPTGFTCGSTSTTDCAGVINTSPDTIFDYLEAHPGQGVLLDVRSGSQKSAGCSPCKLAFDSAVITVQDNEGTQLSFVIDLKE